MILIKIFESALSRWAGGQTIKQVIGSLLIYYFKGGTAMTEEKRTAHRNENMWAVKEFKHSLLRQRGLGFESCISHNHPGTLPGHCVTL